MADEKCKFDIAIRTECRADSLAHFNSSQSSQLFINCCFALSLSGVFFTVIEAVQRNLYYMFWVPFTMYLVFLVWRQYSVYYIPLQFYRNTPAKETDELSTLVITLTLALFPLVCMYRQHWGLVCLSGILGLNLVKLEQMKRMLREPVTPPTRALEELKDFSRRLWVYLMLIGVFFLILLPVESRLNEGVYIVIVGLFIPLVVYPITRLVYASFWSRQTVRAAPLTPEEYVRLVALSFARQTPGGQVDGR